MKILLMYKAAGTYFCYRTKVIAIYPNNSIVTTSIPVKKFPLYIQDGTIKLVEKPI